jgi:hypothetical protein
VRRALAGGLVLVASFTAGVMSAEAATVRSVLGERTGEVEILAAPGEANSITVTGLPPDPELYVHLDPAFAGSVLVRDPGVPLTAEGERCLSIDAHTVHCTGESENHPGLPAWLSTVTVQLGDRSDKLLIPRNSLRLGLSARGEGGSDVIQNYTDWDNSLAGGDGDDTLLIRGGDATLSGDAGDDFFDVRFNSVGHELLCGTGHDVVEGDHGEDRYAFECEEFRLLPELPVPLPHLPL